VIERSKYLRTVLSLMMWCVGIGVACSRGLPTPHNERSFSGRLELAVSKKKDNKEPVVVNVAQLTDFDWDRMFVFAPYTDVATVQKTIGYEWGGARISQIDSQDRFHLLVFTKQGKVVKYFQYPRGAGGFEFTPTDWSEGFTKDTAVFVVEEEHMLGETSLRLIPVRKGSKS
jgi:hypothetical protein